MTAATPPPPPATIADLDEYGLYTIYEAARLLRQHPETLLRNGLKTRPRKTRTSPHMAFGRDIWEYAGFREVDRAARTCEPSETQRQRERRAEEAMERVRELARATRAGGGKRK